MSFNVTAMAASQSCNTSMPENFRNIYGNIVSIGKGIALIAMRFVVAQVQQFVGFFLHLFFRKQKTLESVWRTKRSQFLNLQALCLLRRSFFLWFTNKSKIATAHKRIAKETNFCDGLVN